MSRRTRTLPLISILLLASAAVACGGDEVPPPAAPAPVALSAPAAPAAPPLPVAPGHSIDLSAMDTSVKPGDDFFLYANGSWYAKAEIPPDRGSTGAGYRITKEIEKRTSALLEDAGKSGAPDVKQIGDYYAAYMDEAGIEARGIKPLAPVLARIAAIRNAKTLAQVLGAGVRADVDPLNNTSFYTTNVLGLWVEQDLNDPSRYAPYLLQGGLGMPDRSYYVDDASADTRTKYAAHLAKMLTLAGVADAKAKADRVLAFERKMAAVQGTRVDSEDVGKANNVWARADFGKLAPGMDWDAFLGAAGLGSQASFIVWQPSAVKGLAALVKSEPLSVWKEYLAVRAIERAAELLPKAFGDELFAFYATELQGVPARPPRWKDGVRLTNEALGDAVGKAYVARYFPPESKQAVEKLVADLVAAFGRRIDGLSWMSPATKAKAKEKLATLQVGVGYPDKWRDDTGLTVTRDDALGNEQRAELFRYQGRVALLGKPVDRREWSMVAQVVNAVNMPVRNALNFPAGILVPPYFDPSATAAANYGGIGAVIGHEISHSFDDEGSKFDAQGRYASWWTPEDYAHFQASGAALAAQFGAYHPLPDVAIDGKLTLSENIADLAGLAVAFDAWRTSLGGQPAPTQDGFTGEQQFFLAFAQGWQSKMREPLLRQRLKVDGHAPPHFRVFTVRNLDPWYAAFGVKEGDALFLAPPSRVRVW